MASMTYNEFFRELLFTATRVYNSGSQKSRAHYTILCTQISLFITKANIKIIKLSLVQITFKTFKSIKIYKTV